MMILFGFLTFVLIMIAVNVIIKKADQDAQIKHTSNNENLIELDKEVKIPEGRNFCKDCKFLIYNKALDHRFHNLPMCDHPDVYEQVAFDVVKGQPIVKRVKSGDVYKEWNKNCTCSRFVAKNK